MNAIRSICFIDVYRLEERENNGFDFQLFQPSITHFLSLFPTDCIRIEESHLNILESHIYMYINVCA